MADDDSLLLPWDIHPSLTPDRLSVIESVIREKATEVAKRLDRKKGDTLLGVGVARYERTTFALTELVKSRQYPWLGVDFTDLHFVVKIGGVPLRIFRGFADEVFAPDRYSQRNESEVMALQQAFNLVDTPTPDSLFRFQLETDSDGFPLRIWLLQVDAHGRKHNHYVIPRAIAKRQETRRKSAKILPMPNVKSANEQQKPDEKEGTSGDV